jgi:hypothetical protein
LEPGESPKPVKGNAGVYFVEVLEKVEAVEPQTLANQQTQLKNAFRNRVPNEAFRALEQSADVEDNRHRFY